MSYGFNAILGVSSEYQAGHGKAVWWSCFRPFEGPEAAVLVEEMAASGRSGGERLGLAIRLAPRAKSDTLAVACLGPTGMSSIAGSRALDLNASPRYR